MEEHRERVVQMLKDKACAGSYQTRAMFRLGTLPSPNTPFPPEEFDDFVQELRGRSDILSQIPTLLDAVTEDALTPYTWLSDFISSLLDRVLTITMPFHFPASLMFLQFIVFCLEIDISRHLQYHLDQFAKSARVWSTSEFWRAYLEAVDKMIEFCDYYFAVPIPRVAKPRALEA